MSGAALITGGARRIGRAIALALAREGYNVAVHRRSEGLDADGRAEIESLGRRLAEPTADLERPEEAAALARRASEALGAPLTLLVNNASVFEDDRLEDLTPESLQRHIAVNLAAPVLLSQAFAAQAPQGGSIVNIVDQRVLHLNPQFFSYTLSKAALWTATRTMAQALAPRLRVNAVGPGPTLPSVHQGPGEFEAEAAHVPLQRRATPEQVADAVLFLVRSQSITGQMICVDGGQHLAWRTPDIQGP